VSALRSGLAPVLTDSIIAMLDQSGPAASRLR